MFNSPNRTTDDFACSVSADLFSRTYNATGKDETRYYLQGVFVTQARDGGALLVATDGHILLVIRDADGWARGSGIVRLNKSMQRAASKAIQPSHVGPESRRVVANRTRAAVVQCSDERNHSEADLEFLSDPDRSVKALQWREVFIDGSYPEWQKVVPTEFEDKADATVAISPALLLKLGMALGDPRGNGIDLRIGGPESAWLVTSRSYSDAFGVIMPVKVREKPETGDFWRSGSNAETPDAE